MLALLCGTARANCLTGIDVTQSVVPELDQRYYVDGSNSLLTVNFDFTHSPDCGFYRSYTLTVDGYSPPTWISMIYAPGSNDAPIVTA